MKRDTVLEEEEMIQISMNIIINAGNAQNELMQIIQGLTTDIPMQALREKLIVAKELIIKAHQAQTTVIQGESRGEKVLYSLLFNHAQDTLMMAQAEVLFVGCLIDLYEQMNKRFEALEEM